MTDMRRIMTGVQDSRSNRGIFARGKARYTGPSNAPKPGNMNLIQAAARKRMKKINDMRRFR